jgi:hypothetical protein
MLTDMRDVVVFRPARILAVLVLAVLPAACGGNAGPAPAPLPPAASTMQNAVAAPPAAATVAVREVGGATQAGSGTKSKSETIKPGGGHFSLPKLPSLKGKLAYPSNDADAGSKVAFEASLTNVFNAPTPPSANIVYFLSATLNSSQFDISFNSGTDKAKIVGSILDPTKSYTLYVYIPLLSGQPVETLSLGSPNAQHELEFSSPFSGATLPTKTVAYLELGQS